jgi:hypothetical protein
MRMLVITHELRWIADEVAPSSPTGIAIAQEDQQAQPSPARCAVPSSPSLSAHWPFSGRPIQPFMPSTADIGGPEYRGGTDHSLEQLSKLLAAAGKTKLIGKEKHVQKRHEPSTMDKLKTHDLSP